jgi:hypothetical protein
LVIACSIFLYNGDEECINDVNNRLIRFSPVADAFMRRNKSSPSIEDREFHYKVSDCQLVKEFTTWNHVFNHERQESCLPVHEVIREHNGCTLKNILP